MDTLTAKNILGISNPISLESLSDVYKHKKSILLFKKDSGIDVTKELEEIEDAFVCLSQEFQDVKEQPGSLVPVQKDNSLSTQPTYPSQLQNNMTTDSFSPCPNCGKLIPKGIMICDLCQTQIARSCPSCGNVISLDARTCERCGTPIQEYDRRRFAQTINTEQRISQERTDIEINAAQSEKENRDFVVKGIIIWLIIIVIVIAFCILAYFLFNNYLNV